MVNKTKYGIFVVIGVILLMGVGIFIYVLSMDDKSLLDLYGVYDKDGNRIEPSSLTEQTWLEANEQQYFGAQYIKLEITPKNDDTIALNFDIISATTTPTGPGSTAAFSNALTFSTHTAVAGNTGDSWITDLIDISQFVSGSALETVDFVITVEASNIDWRIPSQQSATITIKVSEDPTADFSLILGPVGF